MKRRGNEDGVRTSFFQTCSFSQSDLVPPKKKKKATISPRFRTLDLHTHKPPSLRAADSVSSRQELPRTISKIHIPGTLLLEDPGKDPGNLGAQPPRGSLGSVRLYGSPPHTQLRRPFLNPARIKRLQRQLPAWVPGAGGRFGSKLNPASGKAARQEPTRTW